MGATSQAEQELRRRILLLERKVSLLSGKLPTITATTAANALTIGVSEQYLDFRSATLGSGQITNILATPSSIVIPSGATMGGVNAKLTRLIVGVMNVSGVAELFVANAHSGNYLIEANLITTTALSTASDSADVNYSTSARTNMPFRILGYVDSTQATAGTWATAPSSIRPIGSTAEILQQTGFRAYQSTTQAIAATTFTKILFQTEDYDIGGNFSSSSFTAPVPGIYEFSVAINCAMVDGQRTISLFYVDSLVHSRVYDSVTGGAGRTSSGSAAIRLLAGQVVDVYFWSSLAEDTIIGSDLTYFSGHRIG